MRIKRGDKKKKTVPATIFSIMKLSNIQSFNLKTKKKVKYNHNNMKNQNF